MLYIFTVIYKLALPLLIISWLLFSSLYSGGDISPTLDSRSLRASLKKMKQDFKRKEAPKKGFLYQRWMRLGGGFYGLAALWTLFIVELSDLMNFIQEFPGFAALLEAGLVGLIINLIIDQLEKFFTALFWFSYWPQGNQSLLIWVGLAYLGYFLGMSLAKKGFGLDSFLPPKEENCE